ncbi:MAG: hypothetical protein DSY87_03620 [Methylococcus sp.]|nr:MAG: hypothetical protein DSY87_03620 [Methylococcus sp.]
MANSRALSRIDDLFAEITAAVTGPLHGPFGPHQFDRQFYNPPGARIMKYAVLMLPRIALGIAEVLKKKRSPLSM